MVYVIRLCAIILGISFALPCVWAKGETLDVQAFLPLFERNSLGRKVLDVRYSESAEADDGGKMRFVKVDVHLVFDAETGKYREEVTYYRPPPNDADASSFIVKMWDGKEFVEWERLTFNEPGFRALGAGLYEHPGEAVISSQPITPSFVTFCYDTSYANVYLRPFAKTVPEQNPQASILDRDTITIEAVPFAKALNRFEFSKDTGVLRKFVRYYPNKNNEMIARDTQEFSGHVECSGFWIPLRMVATERQPNDGSLSHKSVISVDPKTLRLLDTVEDVSIFSKALPAGCAVIDEVRKIEYTVTTANTLPNDVDALKKVLDKMLEQAQGQKEALEQK